jgi:N-acetylglucosaminyldiphosphoundecaprenol N-acetyl-beta-D-mannosaminyltransferase
MEVQGDGNTIQIPAPKVFMGIPIHPVTATQLVDIIVHWGSGTEFRRVYNVNVHAMNLAEEQPDFKRFLQHADLVFCDGFGVKLMAKVAGIDIPERMTPPDWIDDFAEKAANRGLSVFALGDEDGVAAQFLDLLRSRHPRLIVAGSHHGFFAKSGPENDAIIETINKSGATFLFVGFGMPLQERWIEQNAHALQVKVALPVGALFRWYAGYEKRAPRWVTDLGLEWLARFIRHPVRLFKRYAVGNPLFAARVLRSMVTGRQS